MRPRKRHKVKLIDMRPKLKRSKLVLLEVNENNIFNVILFKDNKWNKYVTLGGRVDKEDDYNFAKALIREVKEESLNLFDVSEIINVPENHIFFDMDDGVYITRIYFILLKSSMVNQQIYDSNRDILMKTDNVPHSWKELNGFDKFPIENIIEIANRKKNKLKKEYVNCKNINGDNQCIYPPVIDYIREAIRLNLMKCIQNIRYARSECSIDINKSVSFLNGTTTIKLK